MKKKFIIHIGPHKTGSTYIQKVLFDNQTTLSEIGIDYSSIMKEGQIAHHELAEKLHAKQYTDASNLIDQMKATQLDVLISSENFDRLSAEKIEFLAQCLQDRHVVIVFFIRRLDDLLISSWQESIKHGQTESWSKYCFNHILRPFISDILNFAKVLDPYSAFFGMENIKIIDFDNAQNAKEDICDLLFKAINIPLPKALGTGVQINRSMPYSMIEIIRLLNIKYRKVHGKHPQHNLRSRFLDYHKEFKDERINQLQEIINKNLESLDFTNVWLFNFLTNEFQKKYQHCIVNKTPDYSIRPKHYLMPDESWHTDPDAIELIETLFQKIETNYV